MSLLVYNLTAAPLVLDNGLNTEIPASTAGAGVRGKPWYASGAELEGRSAPEYAALQAQQDAGLVAFQWENSPEYPTVGLTVSSAIDAAPLSVAGSAIANVANEQAVSGTPQAYVFDIADAAGDTDIVMPRKFEVHDVRGFKTGGAGGAGDTVQVKNAADAITDAVSLNVADQAALAAASYDDAFSTVLAAGTLRVTVVDGNAGATDLSCRLVVSGVLRS